MNRSIMPRGGASAGRLSGVGRLAKPYPAPTASHVPALAVNTTVAMKITASIRDKVHAVGIWKWPRCVPGAVDNLCISCG
jgi:hypothetical protein